MSFSTTRNSLRIYRLILILLCLILSTDCKYTIFSSAVQLTFDQYSAIKQVKLRFMPQTCFHKNDFMMISFLQPLEDTITVPLTFSLMNQFTKQIATGTFVHTADATIIGTYGMKMFKSGTESSYVSDLSQAVWFMSSSQIKSQWLTLVLKIPKNVNNQFQFSLGSVNMAIVSSLNPQSVKYQYSNAMSYFYFATLIPSPPPQNIGARIANADYGKSGQTGQSYSPGALYPIYMELIPVISFKNTQLNLQFTSLTQAQVLASTTETKVLDFQFQGTCYFICQSTITCITALSCNVKPDKIEVNIAELIMGQKYVLRFSVLNPPYQASKNFLLWSDAVGSIYDTVKVVTSVSTTPISITIQPDDLKLLWKIPASVVASNMGLGFFINGGINTVQVGFQITAGSPFGQVLEVNINTGTYQLIMESIQHNLPCINTTISYQFSQPLLTIRNVTALTRTGYRYWVAFRARYATSDQTRLNVIGTTTIKLARYPTQLLFNTGTANTVRLYQDWTSFLDTGGFHNPLLFKNSESQVISSTDNGLQNGTSQAIRKYMQEPTTVGVDASIPNQQLLFLMKVPPAMFSAPPIGLTDKYHTRIYYNPNIIPTVSSYGLEVVAYKQGPNHPLDSKWQTDGNKCYINQSTNFTYQKFMCQKYRDHVDPTQQDNLLIKQVVGPQNSQIPYYSFACGAGVSIMCNKTVGSNCQAECELFSGYDPALSQAMGGVAAMRNVTFVPDYQSPIQAGNNNLDFIVAFYHNDVLIKATLINAYTVKPQNLQQTTFSLINTYKTLVNSNPGDRVPTLIKIQGRLALSQYINLQQPDKMKLYLPPTSIGLNDFIVNSNEMGCSYSCKLNASLSQAVSQNWLEMHSITIEKMPTLTNDFKVLIPVQLKNNLMSIYIGFEARGKLVAVYRIGGSSVKALVLETLNNIFTIQTRTPEWNLITDWSIIPYTLADYKQCINLQQTNTQDNFTIISMALSNMPNRISPFVTVTIRNLDILADYTSITVGNSLRNRTCDKFNYFYTSPSIPLITTKVQTIVCQMYGNDNTTNNNIRIDYPLFSNMLGPGFPYDQVFTYAYTSDADGSLEAIRRETAEKSKINLCRTNKATEYNVDELGRQLEIFRIQVDPILLSTTTYQKLHIILTLPPNILAVECTAFEAIFGKKMKCSVVLPLAAQTTLLLQMIDTVSIKLLDFYVYLNCKQVVGAVNLVPNTKYQVEVRLPHTNALNQQVIYGSLFTSFMSTAYSCQNTFTYIKATYNKAILVSKHQLNTIAINLNTELQFTLVFSKQKSTLLANSHIEFVFDGLLVNQESFCYLKEFEHVFWTRQFTSTTYKLITSVDVPALTDNPVTVKCSNLILTSPNTTSPTVVIKVFDITANIQIMTSLDGVPAYPLTTKPYFTQTPTLSTAGSITTKQYTTLGFNGQYTLKYQLPGSGLVEGFIDLSDYWFDDRIVGCKLSITQDVFCKPYELNTNSSLQYRSKFIYFKTYYPSAFTDVTITIYPVLQERQQTAPIIHTIMKLGTVLYYLPIADTLPLTPIDDVFFINNYNIIPSSNLTSVKFSLDIIFQFKAAVSHPLFVQLNQILFYNSIVGVVLKCTLNGTVFPCSVVQKDLVKLGTFSYAAGASYLLKIESFEPNYQIVLRDKQNFFMRMFVINPTTKQIDYVSYLNTDLSLATALMTLIKSYQASVNKPSLVWNLTTSLGSTYLPKIYIGYYGLPIDLIVYDSSKFVTEFTLASTSYNSTTFKCDMGNSNCQFSLIADSFNSVIKQFQFTHTSTYYMQPPMLEVEVSNQKCVIVTEFDNYKIFQNGMTLPIILNFTHCRPKTMLTIVPHLSSTDLRIDDSFSELQVTYDNPIAIMFVRHSSTVLSLVNYTMNFTLTGQYSNSFQMPAGNITIQKIARTQSSIQAKLPQILTLTENSTSLRIQCNQPSTVYWAIGFYPTTLGQEGQDIQTRLLNGQNGLKTSIVDPFTYGNLEYGLTYTDTPNVWKTLDIDNLQGNLVYTFKYFCVNIKGSFSDGQILTFTTPQSNYQLVKLSLGFPTPLTFTMVNDFACAISQSLTLHYNDTRSSVNTNCKNAPLIFYDSNQELIRDLNTSGDKSYFYNNFYIRSTTEPSQKIVSIIRDKLKNNSRILKTQLPLWEVFNIEQIQPDVITPGFEGQVEIQYGQTEISMTIPIRNQQFYVVIGLLSSFFNATSMSLPETYMIKSGKFSQNVDFDKVFMNYTTAPITFNFEGLTAGTQYSIFYFVTVDNPAINAKHSEVKYINLVTKPYLTIDLFGENLFMNVYLWCGVLLIGLFFS